MHFHANYVSTSAFGDGDYYQATFEAEQDTDDPDSPYLLIQRQFEDPACRLGFFLPVSVLSRLFRRRFLEGLNAAYQAGRLQFFADQAALAQPAAFQTFLAALRKVECHPRFDGTVRRIAARAIE